ncbi:hypothetical protein J2T12_002715 [Paenibacillus anaericanus]|nr:hypothetical protein [Paenibacillus anaericanus]
MDEQSGILVLYEGIEYRSYEKGTGLRKYPGRDSPGYLPKLASVNQVNCT